MITLHHLHQSRSFRVVWLMEELGLPYDLVCHARNPDRSAPDALAAVSPLKKSPVIVDGKTVLFESGAILEYVIHRYGHGRLSVPPHHLDYPHYLQWLHAAEGTCMPSMMPLALHVLADMPAPIARQSHFAETVLHVADEALADRPYFGSADFSAADIMMETYIGMAARYAAESYATAPRLASFLDRVRARDGYRQAREVTAPSA